jgi:hypothetical protein
LIFSKILIRKNVFFSSQPPNARPAGYTHLAQISEKRFLPHHVEFYVSNTHVRKDETIDGFQRRILPIAQWPGDDTYSQLKFALRYEGLHLGILREVIPKLDPLQLASDIRHEPLGAYARRIWYLYEELTGQKLDILDLTSGNYLPLADPEDYYTGPIRRSARHRIQNNLLGDLSFCFIIRRTKELTAEEEEKYDAACQSHVENALPEIYDRALDYLYKKETKSSFEIERETPDQRRTSAFIRLLKESDHQDYFQKATLIRLQNAIVDPRFSNSGWRDSMNPPEQNFVSGGNAPNLEGIHYIPPRPQEIESLMQGWLKASRLATDSEVPPVVVAAAVAWSFVFLHPFSDGNGRIHRFLIHHVLAKSGFAPRGLIFPVSAAILNDPRSYDASLEAFSRPLMDLLEWEMDDNHNLKVKGDSSDFYRAINFAPMASALYRFVKRTVEHELPNELAYLRGYDVARKAMREVVDMPDSLADLFIQLCKQNGYKLSQAKRNMGGIAKLTDREIEQLEVILQKAFIIAEN